MGHGCSGAPRAELGSEVRAERLGIGSCNQGSGSEETLKALEERIRTGRAGLRPCPQVCRPSRTAGFRAGSGAGELGVQAQTSGAVA